MNDDLTDNVISIRELQRNAAEVMSRVERGSSYTIRRHGRAVGRLLPPDPAEEALNQAIVDGVLDAAALTGARTASQVARIPREPTPGSGASPVSDALAELREDER